jgi:RNA polymerase sigma-32 factor
MIVMGQTTLRNVPLYRADENLSSFLRQIRTFPMLDVEEEQRLARRFKDNKDLDAAHRLITSHLRLAAKIASGYRGYGLPLNELVSEANVGLIQAVERFDPERGFRLATYAMWWIRASIQEYILHSWSLVRLGTTAQQKKLFFNLRKLKGQLQALEDGDLQPETVRSIAETLAVSESDVVMMNRRLAGGDHSLNTPMREDGDGEWQDWLVDSAVGQEERLAEHDERDFRSGLLEGAIGTLSPRERDIIVERRLREEPLTLEKLALRYGISRERVRQIEVTAMTKLQKTVLDSAAERSRDAARKLRDGGDTMTRHV